jgi:arsenite-transporting ATPase
VPDQFPAEPARLILYVGKGGVGKTTLAAMTAARAAELGHRTLVISTDIAHSLGDVMDVQLDDVPREVSNRLFAQEINVLAEARKSWGRIEGRVSEFLRREGIPDVQADELAILPGMEEVAALGVVGRLSRAGAYDCVVVDAAPTGETIRLLSMPETFQWYAGRLKAWRGRLNRVARGLMRSAFSDFNIVDVLDDMAARVKELKETLSDARYSSYRLVLTPDRVVLKEAQRAETYLNLFEYPVDAVVVNRILPIAETGNTFLDSLISRQARYLLEIRQAFGTLPVLELSLQATEPVGVTALAQLAALVFEERDPTAILHTGPTQTIEKDRDGYLLRIPMPNVESDRLMLTKRTDGLYVEIGNVRREIMLPATLTSLEPGVARMRGGVLEIPFSRPARDANPAHE